MRSLPPAVHGPLFMVAATGFYVVNDSFMKLATDGLPPFQVLFMRGVAALSWGLPLLVALGYFRALPLVLERQVVLRNAIELVAVLCYVVALANMPIADVIALGQVTPLLLIVGAGLYLGERIGPMRAALIGLGFAGALMVAQPTMAGIGAYALLAFGNAVFCAVRDLVGLRIDRRIPGMVVALSAVIVVMAGAGAAHVTAEEWASPSPRHLLLLAAAGFFLIFGHFCLFMAYRAAPTATVAPFYYCFSVWAVVSGLIVFGELPDPMAATGITLVVGSGLAIILLDRRRRPAAA